MILVGRLGVVGGRWTISARTRSYSRLGLRALTTKTGLTHLALCGEAELWLLWVSCVFSTLFQNSPEFHQIFARISNCSTLQKKYNHNAAFPPRGASHTSGGRARGRHVPATKGIILQAQPRSRCLCSKLGSRREASAGPEREVITYLTCNTTYYNVIQHIYSMIQK